MSEFIVEPEPNMPDAAKDLSVAHGGEEDASTSTIPGWRHLYSGKVRELYVPDESGAHYVAPNLAGRADIVLVVATDRISAFDYVLTSVIPEKGEILTRLTAWWLDQLGDIVPDHRLPKSDPAAVVPAVVAGRAMVCRRLEMFPVECVVRGYLAGSGLSDYRRTGGVCGVTLPSGLVDGSRLPSPVFTPARKAALGDHDENIDFATMAIEVGAAAAAQLRATTVAIYERAERIARDRGIILADTKLEFGTVPSAGADGTALLVLGDEVLTPDSSRFWDAESWRPGGSQPSFDKQYVRDWLTSPEAGWDPKGAVVPPALPARVIDATRARYVDAYERLTGFAF